MVCKKTMKIVRGVPHDFVENALVKFGKTQTQTSIFAQPPSSANGDESNSRTDIAFVDKSFKRVEVDVTTSEPTAASNSTKASKFTGVCASASAKNKNTKHKAKCESVGSSFFPFSIELYGLMHESCYLVIHKLTELMYRAGNEFSTPKEREAYLKNVVSTQLHRGLAHGLKAFTSLVHKKLYSNGGGIQALDAYSRGEISEPILPKFQQHD